MEQLQQMARNSLARGHWRVALRRILMARATGGALATDMDEALEHYLPMVSVEEMWRMQDSASQWMLMTRGISIGFNC
ncbi:hypothetical protein HNP48_006589 [Acidovorax soli]|uniref:Uncharacterized protein n=1 Tax=Acidovorax soli TaxID=592050 RepID=A0A7X0UD68_9BURK|nr:hypothetical protein [Acidovorax soli]MBB6563863.1 hypothetical protein [Acidovorax soli]